MGRTNIFIDDSLIKKVMAITGARSKREAVDLALQKLVDRSTLFTHLKKLKGKLAWEGDLEAWRQERK